jgi:hypothetical protein
MLRLEAGGTTLLILVTWLALPAPSLAQQADRPTAETPPQSWQWSWDANAFLSWNYQYRKFRDFQELESLNWLMAHVARPVGRGRLRIGAMLSLEPLTVQDLGSPQVFQTGETFKQAALVDYQHPHDLVGGLGLTYSWRVGRFDALVEAALVGAPSLGPPVFMHRPSAIENPTVPLAHHQMDASHITPGVLRLGIERSGIGVEGSWFRGAEPDENRLDFDVGALDSWALRASWRRGPWSAQVSGGHLTTPEWTEPFADVTRLTASIAYASADGRLASTIAWGQNREIHGILDAYLAEATLRVGARAAAYARAELVAKDILGAGSRHPPGFAHPHPLSRIGAFTAGYVHDVRVSALGRWGVGGDATLYRVPPNLREPYGSPASFHVFLRYRPPARQAHHH